MGDSSSQALDLTDWFQPNTYSLWAYDRGSDQEPILFVVYEWERAGLRGVRVESVWLHEDLDRSVSWEDYPEFNEISGDPESVVFALLIETRKIHRIGKMPQIGRYSASPSWLQ